MEMSVIEELIEKAKQSSLCRVVVTNLDTPDPLEFESPHDVSEFFKSVDHIIFGEQEFDGEALWMWRIGPTSKLQKLLECRNPYGVEATGNVSHEIHYLRLIAESSSGEDDIAIFMGGTYSGYCVSVHDDTLLPESRMSVLAESFSELVENFIRIAELPVFEASDEVFQWAQRSNPLVL